MAKSILKVVLLLLPAVCCGAQDRIRLQDLQVVTLYHGRYTSARRSHAVPQMQCMGGTAGCSAFVPQVVQCYNRGFDGYDVQWECKTDMDNAYRFGQIAVNCEGYDYPDDPYILRGSCGLEYFLELTKEGYQHHSSNQKTNYVHQQTYRSDHGIASTFVNVVMFVIAVIVIGSVVYMCWFHPHHDAPPPYPGPPGYGVPPHATAPPPPAGFRSDYMPFSSSSGPAGCSYQSGYGYDSSHHSAGVGGGGGTGGGFWTGAAAGGLAGYLFGSRGRSHTYTHQAPYQPPPQPTSSWWSSGSSSSSGGQWSSSASGSADSNSASTGTRTASGFGATKRR